VITPSEYVAVQSEGQICVRSASDDAQQRQGSNVVSDCCMTATSSHLLGGRKSPYSQAQRHPWGCVQAGFGIKGVPESAAPHSSPASAAQAGQVSPSNTAA
jgi:hypothetical protein